MTQQPDVGGPGGSRRAGLGEPKGSVADRRVLTEFGVDVEQIEAEELVAARRRSSIEAGRRMGGVLGAATAGAMLGLRDIYEGPLKDDDIVAVAEVPGDPGDIDTDGISGSVADVDYWAPPPGHASEL